MYYKIKNNILFRQYEEYGYITDNSMFGYQKPNDNTIIVGEKYVSQSGAIMLSLLEKEPKHIDKIIEELLEIFIGVEFDELKADVIDFFNEFVNEGFLSCGISSDECNLNDNVQRSLSEINSTIIPDDSCSKNVINQNDFLRSLHIEIADECNERCIHCYIPHEYKNKTIDKDLFIKIVEEGRELNIINVTLSGGEPFLHKDFIEFMSICRKLDLSVNVLSNLTLLTKDIISEMKKNPLLSVQTSLYSMDPFIHDSITKVKGSFEKTKNAILRLQSENIPLQISCPVMKQNKETFYDVVLWGKENNICVAVDPVIFASYDHSNCNLCNRLSLDEIGETIDKQLNDAYVESVMNSYEEKMEQTENDNVCSVCRYYLCVSASGEAYPCVGWQTKVIGNLNNQSIKEIWNDSVESEKLREIKRKEFPKCVDCKDRGYCTICMMSNSNENPDGNAFEINDFHCDVASLLHTKIDSYIKSK